MASFGEELRRERELRDISLKEISEATKISIRFLEALEQNNFDILPGGIFNRGFIRSYARFIGIDGEEMVNAYLHETSLRDARKAQAGVTGPQNRAETGAIYRPEGRRAPRAEARPEPQTTIPAESRSSSVTWESHQSSGGRISMALWVVVVLGLVAVATFVTLSLTGEPAGGAGSSHDQAVRARLARKSPAPATASVSPQDEASVPQPSAETPAQAPAEAQGPVVEPEAAAPSSPSASPPAPEGAAPTVPQHQLRIRAVEETTRVVVECGGRISLDQQMWPGQTRTLDCAEPVVLSAANAGAVEFSLDGGQAALLGAVGEEIEGLTVAPPPPVEKPAPSTTGPKKDSNAGN